MFITTIIIMTYLQAMDQLDSDITGYNMATGGVGLTGLVNLVQQDRQALLQTNYASRTEEEAEYVRQSASIGAETSPPPSHRNSSSQSRPQSRLSPALLLSASRASEDDRWEENGGMGEGGEDERRDDFQFNTPGIAHGTGEDDESTF
jgi:hypothetical protein